MLTLLLSFISFAAQSLAQQSASTTLEGWQFDDDSRSSWDILWTCLSTIFACTWAALHLHVPERTFTKQGKARVRVFAWFGALLAPELMIIYAAVDFHYARVIVKRCNDAFAAKKTQGSKDAGQQKEQVHASEDEVHENADRRPWSMIQGFCIQMDGLQLRTRDDWEYTVSSKNVAPLIEAGVIRPGDLDEETIEDRAKADAAAKLFAVLQSSWVLVNILSRAAYHLPISPIEIATVAYVICAAFSYGLWWYMPRGMQTRITIFLPYARDNDGMPGHIRELLDSRKRCWHRPGYIKPSKEEIDEMWEQSWPPRRHAAWSRECSDGTFDKLSRAEEIKLLLSSILAAHVFCAIHVAA